MNLHSERYSSVVSFISDDYHSCSFRTGYHIYFNFKDRHRCRMGPITYATK
jgi:hypothetical protein